MGYPGYITFNAGFADERDTGRVGSSGTVPRARELEMLPGETLAQLTERAYGVNTAANRDRIRGANGSISGRMRIPY